MKKKKVFSVVLIGVMVALILLVGCSEAAFIPGVDVSDTIRKASNPDELLAYRWQEMAKFYEKSGLLNDGLDSAELSAYRWNAMAQFYADHGMLNYHSNPEAILAYRWQEMAKFYERNGLLNIRVASTD